MRQGTRDRDYATEKTRQGIENREHATGNTRRGDTRQEKNYLAACMSAESIIPSSIPHHSLSPNEQLNTHHNDRNQHRTPLF